jgi:nicotinate phosphoribosyltransferase
MHESLFYRSPPNTVTITPVPLLHDDAGMNGHHAMDGARHEMGTGLLTDLYELTMAQGYLEHNKTGTAVFSLFARKLPQERNFLVCCGLASVADDVRAVRFSGEDLDYLAGLEKFSDDFLDYLRNYRFEGDLYAVPEGRIVFQNEPLIQIEGSLPDVQILETLVLNHYHYQTLVASKAARIAAVSRGKDLVDFGFRRSHTPEGGIFAARAAYIAGFAGTSNVEAGRRYGLPVFGTMAHSYVQVFPSEEDAFRAYVKTFPENAMFLIDTFDTIACARKVVQLAHEGIPFTGVRIDSGDIMGQVRAVRKIFDEGGLHHVRIFVSGGVDEYDIDAWLGAGTPIDAFGVGTKFITSGDIPYLDMAYKLVEYEGRPTFKTSPGKVTFPCKRQVLRFYTDGMMHHDEVVRMGQVENAAPLVERVMSAGSLEKPLPDLSFIREQLARDLAALPERFKKLTKEQYDVVVR